MRKQVKGELIDDGNDRKTIVVTCPFCGTPCKFRDQDQTVSAHCGHDKEANFDDGTVQFEDMERPT
jgi:hypothetical protein